MATQGERRADTRRRLLTAAAELFAERGVDGTSIDAIAERADRTSGAVYDHFGGKDGVLFALLDTWVEELGAVIGAELATATTLEERLGVLTRENKKLRSDLAGYERTKSEDWNEERRENALLREQINDLAAEVITMTAALEGPDSPIVKALAAAPEKPADPRDKITSLADRVKALQKAAASAN